MLNFKAAFQTLFAAASPAEQQPKPEFGQVMLADPLQRFFGAQGKLPAFNPNEVAGKKGIRYFLKMARDDQIKAALALKRFAILSSGWEIAQPEGAPKDWEPAVIVRKMLTELGTPIDEALNAVMSKFTFGFSVSEYIWEERDGYIWLKDLPTRHPYMIEFLQDEFGTLQGLKQINKEFPLEKFYVSIHDFMFGNHYGTSDLEAAFRSWWIKDNSYKWMAMLLERMGIPPIILFYNAATIGKNLPEVMTMLQRLQSATTAAIPRGPSKDDMQPWTPELADNVASVFIPAFKHLNSDIARAILLPGMMGLTPDEGVGSQARSTVHFDVFMMVIEREQRLLQTELNRGAIKKMCDYNFPSTTFANGYPEFRFIPATDDSRQKLMTLWSKLVTDGTVSKQVEDEIHLRRSLRMPDMTEETLERREAQLEQAEHLTNGEPTGQEDPNDTSDKGAEFKYSAEGDVQRARKVMDSADAELMKQVRDALVEAQGVMVASLRRKGASLAFSSDLRIARMDVVQAAADEVLRGAWQSGLQSVKKFSTSVDRHDFAMTPREAVKYIKQKAIDIAGVLRDAIVNDAKVVIINAVKNGESLEHTVQKLIEVFTPFIGGAVDEGTVATPYRLETIVRTNVTDAYNQGRLSAMIDPDVLPYLAAVRYSALLDTRTTEVCSYLHDKLFRVNDPELLRLTPPNHFNCRSLLVPITKAEAKKLGLTEQDFITRAEVGKAADLAGKGFYTLYKPVDCGDALAHLRMYADSLGLELDGAEGGEL